MANKKKVTKKIVTDQKIKPTSSKIANAASIEYTGENRLVFGKKNYIWMLAGIGLIILGMALMTGGAQPNPEVWDDSIAYSFRRITLAPMVILAGLAVEIIAIFK